MPLLLLLLLLTSACAGRLPVQPTLHPLPTHMLCFGYPVQCREDAGSLIYHQPLLAQNYAEWIILVAPAKSVRP